MNGKGGLEFTDWLGQDKGKRKNYHKNAPIQRLSILIFSRRDVTTWLPQPNLSTQHRSKVLPTGDRERLGLITQGSGNSITAGPMDGRLAKVSLKGKVKVELVFPVGKKRDWKFEEICMDGHLLPTLTAMQSSAYFFIKGKIE